VSELILARMMFRPRVLFNHRGAGFTASSLMCATIRSIGEMILCAVCKGFCGVAA